MCKAVAEVNTRRIISRPPRGNVDFFPNNLRVFLMNP
jgi:hypothetical protein